MIRALRQLSLAALFVAPSIASGLACAETRESIYIAAVLDKSGLGAGACTMTCAGGDIIFRDHGYLDVRYANHYPAALAVFNQLLERQSKAKAAAESSFVNLEGAEVRLTDGLGQEVALAPGGQKVLRVDGEGQKELRLDVSNLASGVYFVKLHDNTGHQTIMPLSVVK